VSFKKTGCLCMSESRGIDYKHWIRRKNRPFRPCCWERVLWPTTSRAEPDGRARGRIGSIFQFLHGPMVLYIAKISEDFTSNYLHGLMVWWSLACSINQKMHSSLSTWFNGPVHSWDVRRFHIKL
jgi:hypothetical protein